MISTNGIMDIFAYKIITPTNNVFLYCYIDVIIINYGYIGLNIIHTQNEIMNISTMNRALDTYK